MTETTYKYTYQCRNCGHLFRLEILMGTPKPSGVRCERCGCSWAYPADWQGRAGEWRLPKQRYNKESA